MSPSSSQLPDIRDFVRETYIEGLPYEEAVRYDASVVPTLLAMLDDPSQEAHHANVVSVLGILGGAEVADTLIGFIEKPEGGELSREAYAAKTAAVTALGYLIHRTGSKDALDYLLEGLSPETWQERVGWTSPLLPDAKGRNLQLVRLDIMALALSGHPRAGTALRSLKREPTPPEIRIEMSDLIDEALATHDFVSREGLLAYYKTRR